MNAPDKEMAALIRLGREAAPAPASLPHATDEELARMRTDDDAAELAVAYRHLASCAACRARLLEPANTVARLAASSAAPPQQTSEPSAARALDRASRPPAPVALLVPKRRVFFALAAAAVVALAIGAATMTRKAEEPIAIVQRSYVGMMGGHETEVPGVAPEDVDVELSFTAPAGEGAALLVVDQAGRPLAPVRSFTRAPDGRLVAVVAPRSFAAHEGGAFGLVVVGDQAREREALAAAGASGGEGTAGSPEALAKAVLARGGLRVQTVMIGSSAAATGR